MAIRNVYRKKALVEAYQVGVDEIPDYVNKYVDINKQIVHTLEGDLQFNDGDYLVCNCKGDDHVWVVRKDIFEQTYSLLNSSNV